MMCPFIRRLSTLRKSAPLRLILVVPFVLQIALVVGLTAWLSIQNGYQAVNEVVDQFRNETSNHIQQYLETYVATPHIINRLNADMLHLQHLSLQDLPSLERYLWYQMQAFDTVNEIKFGTEQGGFAAVERLADGSLVSKMASRATGSVYRVYILDQQGQRTRLVDQRPNYDPRRRPWYKGAAASGKATLVDVYQRFSTPKPAIDVITASLPLYDEQKFVGIASVDLALSGISQFLHDLRIGRSSTTFIVDRSGLLIGSSTTQQIFDRQGQSVQQIKATDSQDSLTRFAARSLLNHFGNWAQITTEQQLDFNLNGERQFVQVKPLRDDKGLNWLIVLVVPEDDFTDRINANTQTAILLCMAAFTVATGLGIYTARGITTPIFRLSRAAQAIAHGNLDQTVMVKGAIEINVLAHSFNQMAQQLRDSFAQLARTNEALEIRVEQRTAALQASEAKFAAAFHASPHPICISTFAEGRFIEVNESFCRISEYCLEEIIGHTSTELNFWQLEDRARMTWSLQEKRAVRNQETEVCVKSGCIRTVLLSAELIDLNGQTCILLVAADITERKRTEEALRESEQLLDLFFSQSLDGFFIMMLDQPVQWDSSVDKDQVLDYVFEHQRITKINDAMLAQYGASREQFIGSTPNDLLAHDLAYGKDVWRRFFNAGRLHIETDERRLDGTAMWVEGYYICLYDSQGRIIGHFGVQRDISEAKRDEVVRKQAEAALQASEAELRTLITAIPDPMFVLTAEGQVLEVFAVEPNQLYKPIGEQIGKTLYQIFAKEQADEFLGYIQQVLRTQQMLTVEYSLWMAGRESWFSTRIAPIRHEQVIWLARDITEQRDAALCERKRAEETSILEERNRMAREIHDTLAQAFTSIIVHLDAASQRITTNPDVAQSHLKTGRNLARSGLADARRSVEALRPYILEKRDLTSALEQLAAQIFSHTPVQVTCKAMGEPYALPNEVETNLLRIGQEALTNVFKHAEASEIRVELRYEQSQCVLQIQDNGQGFESSSLSVGQGGQGFGLLGITERAERIGANLMIQSQPGQGTEIIVRVQTS